MKELLLQMNFFLFVLNNKFLLLSVSTCRYVAYRQYTFWTTTSEIVMAIRVLNMPTEDWQLMSLGGSYATLLNLDLCSVTTASFSCLRCLIVRGLGVACSIGWRSLFSAWYDGSCLHNRSSSNTVLM